tara:strand:+ start:1127 stop:2101 length:975 start_codon:yes stop_codon:yes gene_type:complete
LAISSSLKNDISQLIKDEFNLVKNKLITIEFDDKYINELVQQVTITSQNGKLLRPVLTLLIGSFAPQSNDSIKEKIINMAVAVELLHTASLVHDDIVDNATQRRGQKSFNNIYGNNMAVMMGDIIFAKSATFVCDTKNIEVVNKFANTIVDLSMGQLLEMESRNNHFQTKDQYFYRIRKKTASLFETAVWSGGILSEFDETDCNMLKNYGELLGYAFQIFDDIRDFTEIEKKSNNGKNPGIDIQNGIFTLPVILSFDDKSDNPFIGTGGNVDMHQSKKYLDMNGYLKESTEIGNKYIQNAKKSLDKFPDTQLKLLLCKIADSIN